MQCIDLFIFVMVQNDACFAQLVALQNRKLSESNRFRKTYVFNTFFFNLRFAQDSILSKHKINATLIH